MPTPIEHLVMANDILTSLEPALRAQLDEETLRGAFFFGHVAPDARQVSRQPRQTTHFIHVPPANHRPSHLRLLDEHPPLARAAALPAPQAAFMAGYLAHLLFDELWMRQIYLPFFVPELPLFGDKEGEFGPGQNWGERHERILLHNALRAWLERRDWPHLRADLGHILSQAQPASWLDFIADGCLCRWRDLVAVQLASDGDIRTAEFFASYSGVSLDDFIALLEPDVMQARVFARVSLAALDEFQARATAHCRELIAHYLQGPNSCTEGEYW